MKYSKVALTASMMLLCASLALPAGSANAGQILPIPDPGPVPAVPHVGGIPIYSPTPIRPAPGVPIPIYSHPAPLTAITPAAPTFTRVKYKDLHEKSPCSQVKLIRVKNPCKRCCTDPDCVTIKICVPGCGCERVKVRSGGKRVNYDYGKYEVDVRVKNGYIEVDYQD